MLRAGAVGATCPNPMVDHVAGRLGLVRDNSSCQQLDLYALRGLAVQAGWRLSKPGDSCGRRLHVFRTCTFR